LHAYCVYVYAALCSVFVGERENAGGMDACRFECPNMYVRDVVVVFKLFRWGSPPSEKFSHHHPVAAQALRSRTHVSAFALVVY